MSKKTLVSYFPLYTASSSFGLFSQLTDAPWDGVVDNAELDDVYFMQRSGIKLASIFVEQFSTDGVADGGKLINRIYNVCRQKWTRLWHDYIVEYSPLDSFEITKTTAELTAGANNRTKNLENTDTGTVETELGTQVDTEEDNDTSRHGFNSTEAVPVSAEHSESNVTNSGSDTRTDDLKHTETGTDNVETSAAKQALYTEKGNIGYQSYQQLIKQELEVWKWNYFDEVFKDVDKFLTLKVFDGCQTF